MLPSGDCGAELEDFAGDFAAGDAREGERDGQFAFFKPEVEAVQAAGADADNDFVGRGNGVGNIDEAKLARGAVGCELDGFHQKTNLTVDGADGT